MARGSPKRERIDVPVRTRWRPEGELPHRPADQNRRWPRVRHRLQIQQEESERYTETRICCRDRSTGWRPNEVFELQHGRHVLLRPARPVEYGGWGEKPDCLGRAAIEPFTPEWLRAAIERACGRLGEIAGGPHRSRSQRPLAVPALRFQRRLPVRRRGNRRSRRAPEWNSLRGNSTRSTFRKPGRTPAWWPARVRERRACWWSVTAAWWRPA